jgi:UDP-2,3-diacylglucosamine pyrophosphatase LpxH
MRAIPPARHGDGESTSSSATRDEELVKLLILHVSDIHLSTKRYPENHILERAPLILAAVRSMFLTKEEVGAVAMLVAGDIAFAGRRDEYDLTLPFFKTIQQGLAEEFPGSQHRAFFLPGNHDCDFERDDQARQKLIAEPDMGSLADGSIIDVATSLQDEFFDFCQRFSDGDHSPKGLERLYAEHELIVAGKRVVFRMLNSAWLSRKQESRSLMLPIPFLAPHFGSEQAPDLAVSAFHHPYNWFEPNNAHALRELLEAASDVIVTGHEHAAATYTKTGLLGEQNDYVEGGVLQENGDAKTSAFNVIIVEFATSTQVLHHFEWTGSLYETVSPAVERPFVRNKNRLKNEFLLDTSFEEQLNDADTAYSHPQKEHVTLDDIFLYPDCLELQEKQSRATTRAVQMREQKKSTTRSVAVIEQSKSTTHLVRGKELISHIQKKKKIIITAAERAGKTAIARTLFKDMRKNGKIPLLLSGREIKASNIKKLDVYLNDSFVRQYGPHLKTRYWQLPDESRAVIVDDYHRLPETKEARDSFVRELIKRFDVVVFLGGPELRLMELVGRENESAQLWDFNHLEVMAFGHRLRAEFIQKWYWIGRQSDGEDAGGVERMIGLEKTITGILGHDLLPPYPVYLLLLLQQIESANPHDVTAASYGRLYGAVLTAYLAKSGATSDLETKVNYLNELAYHLYQTKQGHLSEEAAALWHAQYCDLHLDRLDYHRFRDELARSQVLLVRNGQISFRYKAGFYYFVAQYMAENITKRPVRDEIKRLCAQTHREAAANIIVFLCHLSKDSLILDEVLANAARLFADVEETDILKDAAFTASMLPKPPKQELELTHPEENRLRALEHRDATEDGVERNDATYSYRLESAEPDEAEVDLATMSINQAVKTIQIAGQILRNFGGRLEGARKLDLADACYALTLRMMKWIYKGFEENEQGLIDAARVSICERHMKIDPTTATEYANMMVFGLLKLATFGLIKQVSTAIGLEKLSPVFTKLLDRKSTVGRRLIDLSIRLDHFSTVPEETVTKLRNDVSGSLIVTDVLRQLVFYRFYYFLAPMPVKQRVCDQMGIKLVPVLLDRDHKRNT